MIELIIFAGVFMLMLFYSAFSWGVVTYNFWYWFLIPLFPEAPEITFTLAVGVHMLLALFKNHNNETIKEKYKDKAMGWAVYMLSPWLTLLAGLIIYHIFIV